MSRPCPQCKAENRDTAQFCSGCRAPLGAAAPTSTPVRYCPAGRHPMDPGWTVCPYCNASVAGAQARPGEETHASGHAAAAPAGRGATVLEPAAEAALTERVPRQDAGSAVRTPEPPPAGEPPPQPGKRRATMFAAPPAAAATAPPRRLAGFLVTYTWKPQGEAFPLYEGRNFIGGADDCDVALADDPQMSGRHAVLLARGGEFFLDDAMSLNGTYVEGERIDEKRRLANYAALRTGATVWRFVAAEPAGTGGAAREEPA